MSDMQAAQTEPPLCLIIAGPNGAGKTTFARKLLPILGIEHFLNVDLIAMGLAPLHPEYAQLQASRLFFAEFDRLMTAKHTFAFESTLSGRGYLSRLLQLREAGYVICIYYLKISSIQMALKRVSTRVKQGGHNVPESDVRRRFVKSWDNFQGLYRPLAHHWAVYDNSYNQNELLELGP